jgi:serine/threonine protein kinase
VGNRVARTVGRYDILDELGRGGMATVYLARQTDLERLVALKELSALRQADQGFTRRFLRESRLAGSLSHPNIVTIHDFFVSDGTPYIAMEYVAGGSLRPHIGHMSLSQVVAVLEGMLSALDHAEGHHIVHRDLKPENVMITSDGRVKIADFGIAKATTQQRSLLTSAGMTVGTPNYMAPEQAMGQDVGPWTDLYSLGVMAFEFFVGHVPFHDTEQPVAVLMRQVSDPIPPARSVNPDVDAAISNWIERLLAKEPADRVQSAGDAWDELEEIAITLVGPRWRRSARLPAASRSPEDLPAGPATPPPTEAPRPPLMPTMKVPDWGPEAPTRRLDEREDEALARTVMPDEAPTRRLKENGQPPPDTRRRRWRLVAKAALLLVALIVAAAAALGGRSSPPAGSDPSETVAAPSANVTSPDLALRVPRGWSKMRRVPELGLPLARAAAASPGGRADGPGVEFGMVKGSEAANDALLPASFLSSVGQSADTPPRRTAVRLPSQGLQAWRYRNLRPVGTGDAVTVYTVPTSEGVATVACAVPPGQAAALARQCDAIASTLRLRRATAYPIGPSKTYAGRLNAAVGGVQQSTDANQPNLDRSDTLAGQAAAANALASAYGSAARQLAGLNLSPADRAVNGPLVSALRTAARAYRSAARAATSGNADAYRTASAAIPGAKAQLNTALAALRAAGYQPAGTGQTGTGEAAPPSPSRPAPAQPQQPKSDVGDSRSDDPSDDSADP